LSKSKPAYNFTILGESAESIQEISGKHQETEGTQHFDVGLVRDIVEFEVNVFSNLWEDIGSKNEADYKRDK